MCIVLSISLNEKSPQIHRIREQDIRFFYNVKPAIHEGFRHPPFFPSKQDILLLLTQHWYILAWPPALETLYGRTIYNQ